MLCITLILRLFIDRLRRKKGVWSISKACLIDCKRRFLDVSFYFDVFCWNFADFFRFWRHRLRVPQRETGSLNRPVKIQMSANALKLLGIDRLTAFS